MLSVDNSVVEVSRPTQTHGLKRTYNTRRQIHTCTSRVRYPRTKFVVPHVWLYVSINIRCFLQTSYPVCVITRKEPIGNAISLAGNRKKSAQLEASNEMTVERWLKTWEEGALMRHSVRAAVIDCHCLISQWVQMPSF